MKSTNRLIAIMLILPFLLLASGCGGGGSKPSGPTLVKITITPGPATIAAGSSQQFTATGTISDGTTQDLTTQVTWSASTGIVQFSTPAGLATTGSGGGTTTISAQLGSVTGSTLATVTGGIVTNANVMSITVNGSLCSPATSQGYFNKPCVSVTVCNPDNSACQTVNDILLDTGSYGLRIFQGAIPNLSLPQIGSGSGSLAECVNFADLSSVWGPIKLANVQMGGEPAVQIPIQVLDASFASNSVASVCGTPATSAVDAGFTGVLGIGALREDCGAACASSLNNGFYFSCTGAGCSGAAAPIADQVRNPVVSLPADNNGLFVKLPAVPLGGAPSLTGSLVFGVGTQSNNIPAVANVFPTNQFGEFTTNFQGSAKTSFLDTGSNALFFASSLPACPSPNSVWYCPPATTQLSATLVGAFGSPSAPILFNVGNANSLFSSQNSVFSEIAGDFTKVNTDPSTASQFDWGLPFFMGRNVVFGMEGGVSASLGTGPYIAY
jgi:hypothetical protein